MSHIFAVVDLPNLFSRARHVVRGTPDEKTGMALHICFRSLRKLHRDLRINHVVACVDSSPSWRHAVYPAYKRKRRLEQEARSKVEKEEAALFASVMEDLIAFLDADSRCTVLRAPGCEADDLVAAWIAAHPGDQHIIVSGDSDYIQLLAPNVSLFVNDNVGQRTITTTEVRDEDDRLRAFSVDSSTGRLKMEEPNENFVPEPDWWRKALFIKIIRGDSGDGVFSAYPGVRFDGSSKRVGIREAWEDRRERGFHWNNFMLQSWDKLLEDGTSRSVRVLDEFRINEGLIDLTRQPDEIKERMAASIAAAKAKTLVAGVGMRFLKFCGRQNLPAIGKEAEYHLAYLNLAYPRASHA